MQVIIASLLLRKQRMFALVLALGLFIPSVFAYPIANTPSFSQVEYALMEEDTTMASLMLQYLNDHSVLALEKQYSQLRLASIAQQEAIIDYIHLAKGDQHLFWQLVSDQSFQRKRSSLSKSAYQDKRSHLEVSARSKSTAYSLNDLAEYPLETYPAFLQNLYREAFDFQPQFIETDQDLIVSRRLALLLLTETMNYFFQPQEFSALHTFYTDYRKHMVWLQLNQIKARFFLERLKCHPSDALEQQLIETYDVFFFLQAELMQKGLLNSRRKKAIWHQFTIEEDALFFYEDLYCRTQDEYWLKKMLQVTENIKSALLLSRQSYYLEEGLLKDLGRSLFSTLDEKENAAATMDSLELIEQQIALAGHYQSCYRIHQLKQKREKQSNRPTLEKVRRLVRDKRIEVLNFFDTEHYLFALLINEKGEHWQAIPKNDSLQQALQYLITACSTPQGAIEANRSVVQSIQQVGYRVYQQLLAPFFKEGIPDRLVIIPDGQLNYLSFETLFTQPIESATSPLPYLIQYSTIRYYPSLSLLLDYEQEEMILVDQVVAYSTDYSQPVSEAFHRKKWGALPGAEAEICAIEARFPTQTMNQSPIDFYPRDFFSSKTPLLHLAMHATTDFDGRKEPGLAFSNAPDGMVFLHDLANYPHLYPVVVLSACETGLGELTEGEGLQSIGQQFLQTGSRSTIQSLSKVADASSSRLMANWYTALAKQMSSDQALKQSKQQYLNKADPFYQHPYFWGGFVAYGQAFRMQ